MIRVRLCPVAPLLLLMAGCNTDPRVVSKKYVDNGNKYFNRGKYKEASIMYRRALGKDKRFADAWYRLGLTDMKLVRLGEARKEFSRAMELDSSNTDAMVKVGDLDMLFYVVNPQSNKALLADMKDLSQQLLKKDPKSYHGLRLDGCVSLLQQDNKTAIQKFKAANQVKPDQPELVLVLSQTLFAEHQDEEAEKLAKALIEKDKTFSPIYNVLYIHYVRSDHADLAEEVLKKKADNNPTNGDIQLELAFHYYASNKKAEMNSTVARVISTPATFPDARMMVGDFYTKIGDFDHALEQFEVGQKESPKNRRTYRKKMVELLGTQGKNEQATQMLTGVLKEDPKDAEAIALHATLLLQKGDRQQIKSVIAELQPLIAKMGGNVVLHHNLGRAYVAAGDPQSLDQARIQFEEALKIEPTYKPAKLALADLALGRGDNPRAVQTAEEIINVDETNLAARLIRASGLVRMREFVKAREELITVSRLYPKSNQAHFQMAQLDLFEHRYPEAEAGFQSLLDANDPRGLVGLIESKSREGHWDQAIQFVDSLLRQSPDRAEYRMALASIYSRAGKQAEAAAQYQLLIDKNPKSADLYVRMGECKVQVNDLAAALAAFQTAKELAPNDPRPRLDLALVFDHTGRFDEARRNYEEALKIQPDNATALNNLAYLKADDGVDLDQALAYAQRAQQARPNDLDVIDTLGLIYIKKNLTEDGLRMLQDLVSKKPESATYRLHLALALYQKGDRSMARKELQAALRNKPTEKETGKIKDLLAKVG